MRASVRNLTLASALGVVLMAAGCQEATQTDAGQAPAAETQAAQALINSQAQIDGAALTGIVFSEDEGAMEGVLVSAKETGSTITTTVVSDENGRYVFPASRLQPGHYDIAIRAAGYKLNGETAVDVAANEAASQDIVLTTVTDVLELGAQLTNADWLNSMPGRGIGCVSCHDFKPILFSTYTADEWVPVIERMSTYCNPSALHTPQPCVIGPRQLRQAPRDPDVVRRTAEYLASINLSQGPVWSYPLQTLPRPKGRATRVIITTYDLPRPVAMPHDAVTTPDGHVWYGDFGHMYIGELDPETGEVTEYEFPVLKPEQPKGFLEVQTDVEGNIWAAGMHQGHIVKIDYETKRLTDYPIPEEWQSDSTQQSMISPQYSHIDGKVWTNNQDDHSILRLDVETGEWECIGSQLRPGEGLVCGETLETAEGNVIRGYGIPVDRDNNLYILQFRAQEIGLVDRATGELKIYETPFTRSRPRRGRIGSDDNLWFAEYGGNAIGMFNPRTETFKEWVLPIENSHPYDAVRNERGDVYTGSMYTDRVTRLIPDTGEFIDYLMPIGVNIRRVFFDDARNEFWIGANNSPYLLKVEPLD